MMKEEGERMKRLYPQLDPALHRKDWTKSLKFEMDDFSSFILPPSSLKFYGTINQKTWNR
jgi:hypothetical protein